MTDPIVQKKISYLQRIRRALFKKQNSSQKPGIPKFFQKITPTDLQWIAHPTNMLPLFQKMILSIREPQERMSVLMHLVGLVDSKKNPDVDYDRTCLQDEIFHAVTGSHYGVLLPHQVHRMSHYTLQERDFFRLIFMGIQAYESMAPEKRDKFNKAVMPNVKKQNVVVPYRLQQYVR